MTARIRFDQLCKTYPGVRALDGVSFEIAPGTIHALVGENGAGKSTLVKILAGAVQKDSGTIAIDGRNVMIRNARDAQALGVAIVYQELNLVGDLSVAENIFLGRWPRSRWGGTIDFVELHKRAGRILSQIGIDLPLTWAVSELSIAQRQMVEIAKALSLEARILILDEPSAVLTPHELQTLFAITREARQRGISVVYISHRLDEIFGIADFVSVLRDGRHISTQAIGEIQRADLIAKMVGRALSDEFPPRESSVGEVMLRCGLWNGRVEFEVRRGEVLGLTGLVGSGRSAVGRTIFGAEKSVVDVLEIGGARSRIRHPRDAIAAGLAMIPEDRKGQGLLLRASIRENMTLASRGDMSRAGFFDARRERRFVSTLMDDLRIRASSMEAAVGTLSGGNQQKTLLARWIGQPRKVIILDEPTRGVDVGAKYEIYVLINRLVAQGTAVLMISSELPEVIGMCDRIGVMHEGRLSGILDNRGREASQETILRLASGEQSGQQAA